MTMPLCLEQLPCVPWKLYNIHYGTKALLVHYQRPRQVLSHLFAEYVYLFVDHLYLLHNFSKEQTQVLIPALGLWGYDGKSILEQNFVSGKSAAITVTEFSVTAVFQENRCYAQHSTSAAKISVPLSELCLLSLPQLIPFKFLRTSWHGEKAVHQALEAEVWD